MFSLQLADGTLIDGLKRINPSTFELISNDNILYHQLNDFNLSFAILLDEDGVMSDVYLDYTLQNFIQQSGIVYFRLTSINELKKQIKHKKEKEIEKWQKYNEKMKERRERK